MERLDKILSNSGYGSRKEVKLLVKNGEIIVDGKKVKDSGMQVDLDKNEVIVKGSRLEYRKYIYLMMNKPAGVVSATFDNYDKTVVDLLKPEHSYFDPFPVGRLDKDTVGLLLLTNNGDMNHKLISPKYHVNKVYYAEINMNVDDEDIKAFNEGIVLDDGYKCLPAKLEILNNDNDGAKVHVTIREGKFHQVKRMFLSRGKTVEYLRRISFGPLNLDEELQEGEYRELSNEEVESLNVV